MEELELYVSLVILLILVVILFWVWTTPLIINKRVTQFDYEPASLNDYVLVSYKGQPCAVSREMFTGEVQKLRDKLVNVIGKASTSVCRKTVSDYLPHLKKAINDFAQNKQDIPMCQAIQTSLLNQSPDYLAARTQFRTTLQQAMKSSQSDVVSSDAFAKDVDELLSILEAVLMTVAKRLCTPQGRLDLDYLNKVVDEMAKKTCDHSQIEQAVVDHALTTGVQPWFTAGKKEQFLPSYEDEERFVHQQRKSTGDKEGFAYARATPQSSPHILTQTIIDPLFTQSRGLNEVANKGDRRKRQQAPPSSIGRTIVHEP